MDRISFFTSPIGLGHATRDAAIASHLKETSIRFTTGGASARLLADAGESVNDVYKPPRFEVDDGGGRLKKTTRWLWRYYNYYKECKSIASRIIRNEAPDIVVSDEDFASVAVAQDAGIKTVLITDILQTNFTSGWPGTAVEKRMNRAMQDMMKRCNTVIMPEIGKSTGNIFRVGPVTRKPNGTRAELRRACKFGKRTILVAVGGTDAGVFLLRKVLDAVDMANFDIGRDTEMVIVAGPSISDEIIREMETDNIRVMRYVNNLHDLILAADVLVSLAGRSTIDEAVAAGTPSIFIPIAGHFEQEENAARFGFSPSDADRLADMIKVKLDEPRAHGQTPSGQGALEAARLIMRQGTGGR